MISVDYTMNALEHSKVRLPFFIHSVLFIYHRLFLRMTFKRYRGFKRLFFMNICQTATVTYHVKRLQAIIFPLITHTITHI